VKRKNIVNLVIVLFFVAFAAALIPLAIKWKHRVFIFEGVAGPDKPTVVPGPVNASLNRYSTGSKSRLAILLTDTGSSWLGLAHGLKSIGLPFLITTDYKQALEHRVVLVYPVISGKVLSVEALRALAAFPRQGGTLIGVNVLGGGLNEVFGFKEAIPSRQHYEIRFSKTHPLVSGFTDPRESVLRIYSKKNSVENGAAILGTHGYTAPKNEPIAVYEDGTAAITQKPYATGQAYAFGIDIGFLMLKGYNYREAGIARSYANGYEPTLDMFLRLIKNIYVRAQPYAVTLASVPFGKPLSVMITHDVDYAQSMQNSIKYAEFEKSQGIKATYFIQTKYLRDWNDVIFFNNQSVLILKQLESLGMEVGSHSVSHAELFSSFPLGSGNERYPSYRPFLKSQFKIKEGTILGELRVSKFLLENFLDKQSVVSFRAGYLSNPSSLPQALEATGYRYSSSVTANKSLTHLPFRLNYKRGFYAETDIFEFPITVEDEHLPKMGYRLPQAIELAKKISKYGGIFVILIHPDMLGHKFKFLKGFIKVFKDYAWFGTVSEFGRWWAARDKIELDVFADKQKSVVKLQIPEKIQGLTLNIPAGSTFESSNPKNLEISAFSDKIIIKEAKGHIELILKNQQTL